MIEDDEESVSRYFIRHNLEPLITELLTEVGKEAPADPLRYMLDYIANKARNLSSVPPHRLSNAAEIVRTHLQKLEEELKDDIDTGDIDKSDLADLQDGVASDVSSAAAKSIILRRIYLKLRNEQGYIHSFLKEWIDNPEGLSEGYMGTRPSRKSSSGGYRTVLVEDTAE